MRSARPFWVTLDPSSSRASRLAIAVAGQLLFASYIVLFYGRALVEGHIDRWNAIMPHGYIDGAPLHNAVVFFHLLCAVAVLVSGAVQLLPIVRRRWPRAHRWNGRVFVVAAAIASIAGLYMVWITGAVGDTSQHAAITLNALLILAFAGLAWRAALARRFDTHRRWALRLFLVVGGVWFFRIGLMLWIVLNQGPAGFDEESFTGPALTALSFGQFLLPLAVLQLYYYADAQRSAAMKFTVAALLAIGSVATIGGIGAAAMILWLPRL